MTTIAACKRERVMCSDSFWTDGEECGFTKKVFRVRGELLGGGGTARYLDQWFAAYRRNKPLPKPIASDVIVLRLSDKGIHVWSSVDDWMQIEQAQFAIGTGGKAARAAMAAGASCARAVRIACDIDASTGGPVRTYRLTPRS